MKPLTKEQRQELKDQWVKALRSNKYKRGKEVLRSKSNNFCCLGVLCDVIDPDGWSDGFSCYHFEASNNNTMYEYLSSDLRDVIGLPESLMKTLVGRNDGLWSHCPSSRKDKGYSFKEQASYIEKHWIIE